jgi:dipeptidyl aminopeptidase/acylaminoacyl peptidase
MRRTAPWLALAAGIAVACPALGQTPSDRFTADVLLRKEDLGSVRVSPDGRWVAMEVQSRYDAAPTYIFAQYTSVSLSHVEVFDTATRTTRHVLQDAGHGAGYVAGPFSPDGRRMVVYRLAQDSWSLGVLAMDTGAVEWTNLTPEESQFGRTVAWRGSDELIVITRPDHSLPLAFKIGGQAQARTRELWANTASGRRVGATYIPSGALRDSRAQAVPLELRRLRLATGDQTVLAKGAIYDFILSPDQRRVAVMEEREDLQPQAGRAIRVGDPMRRRALRLIDIDAGEILLTRSLDYAPYFLSWRPDSGALLAFARPAGGADFEDHGAYVVLGPDGRVEELAGDAHDPAIVRSLWGEPVALGGWRGDTPVLRVRGEDGSARWRSMDGSVDIAARPDDRLVQWAGDLALRRGDRLLALDGEEIARGVPTGRGDLRDSGNRAGFTPDADAYFALRSEGCLQPQPPQASFCLTPPAEGERVLAAGPGVIVTRDDRPDGASAVQLHVGDAIATAAVVNADRAALRWGDVIEVPHPGPGGEALKSWLLLPADLPPGVRAPLVVEVYVGQTYPTKPRNAGRGANSLQNNPAVIAGGGYAVLLASLPNPPGGRFTGAEIASRVLDIVDRAAAAGPVDADRVALIGHSYGAYNVLSAAPHSPRFATVIASNGVADHSQTLILPLFYRVSPDEGVPVGTSIGWAETGQAAIGRFPEEGDRYVDLSPLYDVARLTAPTLLIESDLDRPRYGALFGALYRLNREAAWLNYFGEGHTIASPANVRDLHQRILDWLARYLGPPVGDPPRPMTSPGLEDGGE